MNVFLPYPKSVIAQRFGANANPLYAQSGLKGHTAYDWSVPYGTPIPNCVANAYCYSVMHKDDPDLGKYRAVFTIVKDLQNIYEVSYGHCSEIIAEVGKTYQVGEVLGRVGNTGDVYSGNHYVTLSEKQAGSHAGAHLHGPQIRPVRRVRAQNTSLPNWSSWYLMDENGFYKDSDGYFYETINRDNGYNGCISLALFSTETVAVPQNSSVADEIAAALPTVQEAINAIPNAPQSQRGGLASAISKILAYMASLLKSN